MKKKKKVAQNEATTSEIYLNFAEKYLRILIIFCKNDNQRYVRLPEEGREPLRVN